MPEIQVGENFIRYEIGDFFELVNDIPDKSIDLVLTSPPFKDEDVPHEYYSWLSDVLWELREKSRIVLMFNSSTRLIEICKRFSPTRVLIWNKKRTMQPYRYEPIFIFADDDVKINGGIWNDCISYLPILKQNVPYENPVELYITLLRFFPKAHTILDPFLGSGTTLLACRKTGRNGIGFEIDPQHESAIRDKIMVETSAIESYGD